MLLATGIPGVCSGATVAAPPESGAGLPGPSSAVHGVPTTAQLRKYAAGRSRKTLVFARVVEDNGVSVLDLREAGA